MTKQWRPIALAGAVVAAACGGVAFGDGKPSLGKPGMPALRAQPVENEGSALVGMGLVAEGTALVPGETSWIAARFVIEPGWHLYWKNPGESGLPPSVSFEAPVGVTVGEAVFPAPSKRYRLPTGGVDYIYEGELTLLFPVEVSGALSGRVVTLEAEGAWLVCKDLCLAGDGRASLTVPVAGESRPGAAAKAFEMARARTPRPAADSDAVAARWRGDVLEIEAPGATHLTFYPHKTEALVDPVEIWERGTAAGERLSAPFEGDLDRLEGLGGVVEVERAGGVRELIEIYAPRR